MDVKSFKINDLNILTKVLLTKSEAIGLCDKNRLGVKKAFLKAVIKKLLEIEDISKNFPKQQ